MTKIGINLGIFTVSHQITLRDQDRECLLQVLRKLAEHRALYESFASEYVGEVVNSIQLLRQFFETELGKLPENAAITPTVETLARYCRQFLTDVKNLSEKLKYDIALAKENMQAGVQLMDDQVERIRHYERVGGPDLMTNRSLNVMDIQPPAYQHSFLLALGSLRGSFGTVLGIVCSHTNTAVPKEVRKMIRHEDA